MARRHGPRNALACRRSLGVRLCGLVNDAFDLAAVEVEVPGYGALAVAGVVPGPYRLLYARRFGRRGWCIVVRDGQGIVHVSGAGRRGADPGLRSDEGHQEFE
jgi:hypothetical protein